MYLDFHTHGKLAKYLPFSVPYTQWLFDEAQKAGLTGLCLTEHFNTQQFADIYRYILSASERDGETLLYRGLRIFPGMETDIAEGGHILSLGPVEAILELNARLEPYKQRGRFLPFEQLLQVFSEYPVLVGAAHPFREGGHIPELDARLLQQLDFIDLNGKDVAENRERTEKLTYAMGEKLRIPVVGGSDTHQALQYGCIRTRFLRACNTFEALYAMMQNGEYEIEVHPDAAHRVASATLLKRALKTIDAIGGDYVDVLLNENMDALFEKAKQRTVHSAALVV